MIGKDKKLQVKNSCFDHAAPPPTLLANAFHFHSRKQSTHCIYPPPLRKQLNSKVVVTQKRGYSRWIIQVWGSFQSCTKCLVSSASGGLSLSSTKQILQGQLSSTKGRFWHLLWLPITNRWQCNVPSLMSGMKSGTPLSERRGRERERLCVYVYLKKPPIP